jgi:DUF2950 family protein
MLTSKMMHRRVAIRPSHAILGAALTTAWLFLAADAAAAAAPQPTYASPEQAISSLVAAVKSGNKAELEKILGPGSKKLVTSGDPVADKNIREQFLAEANDATKAVKRDDTHVFFKLGKDEWPFPVPVVAKGSAWRFDSKAGEQEILDRRIGNNELSTIDVCLAYVDAQRDYATKDRNNDGFIEYATRFLSSPGKHDGLYWPAQAGEEESPMGPLMVSAQAEGYKATKGKRTPYHGYYYRILKSQGPHAEGGAVDYVVAGHMIGGFALVAFPAQYGSTGIMTFIVNHAGVVYQKDLGPRTATRAGQMTRFDPDPSWKTP